MKKDVHIPVLAGEVIDLLNIRQGGLYVDGTLGGGNHTQMILERGGSIIGIDRDEDALERVAAKLSPWKDRVVLVHGNFADMKMIAAEHDVLSVDGILLDIGVSSNQLEYADRGFSFMQDGPLDMRMDRGQAESAADLVNELPRDELVKIFREYGEERQSGRIADAIIKDRERKAFSTTAELAETVSCAVGGRKGRIHPATRVFQALRIAVNDELGSLEQGLKDGLELLSVGGRMAVISFHSLEDRMVKQFFNVHAGRNESLQQGGERWVGELPRVKKITRKAVMAAEGEIGINPRSRSAKLRVVERMNHGT